MLRIVMPQRNDSKKEQAFVALHFISSARRTACLPTRQCLCDTRFGEENSFIGRRKRHCGGNHEMHLLSLSHITTTDQVSADLREIGVQDFYLHVICRDQAGLKRHQIHSSNYFETLDVVRDGFIGAALGCLAGLVGVGLLLYTKPFGDHVVQPFVYALLAGAATLFGAWEGGLLGVDSEHKKLAKFHDDLEAGKYLMLVYVRKHREQVVLEMMR